MCRRREIALLLSPLFGERPDLRGVLRDTRRAPVWPAFLARLSDPGFNPVAENISFEFSKDREHACQRSAAGRGQVERFAQRDEADAE
jgi:hypothetical protein